VDLGVLGAVHGLRDLVGVRAAAAAAVVAAVAATIIAAAAGVPPATARVWVATAAAARVWVATTAAARVAATAAPAAAAVVLNAGFVLLPLRLCTIQHEYDNFKLK
jgi:hypothetical protein